MRRTLWPPAAVALFAVIVTGCGSGSAGTGNSTAAGSGNSNGTTSISQEAVKFAECMRTNGVSAFPDPSASGSFTIDQAVNGSSLDPRSATFKQAMSACKSLEPPGFTGAKVTPSQRTARLEFAQCIRKNGVPDFPDPPRTDRSSTRVESHRPQRRPTGASSGPRCRSAALSPPRQA